MPSRRAVLAAGGLALADSLAGCGASSPRPESPSESPTTAWPTAGYDPQGTGRAPVGPRDPTTAWIRRPQSTSPSLFGELSTPVVVGGTIYVAALTTRFYEPDDALGALVALDTQTGNSEWTHGFPVGLTGGPAVVGEETVVVGARDGTLHAFRADGTARWSVGLGGRLTTPTSFGNRLYVATERGRLHAVEADGTRSWTADRPGPLHWVLGPDDPVDTVLPVVDDTGVYVAFTPFGRGRDSVIVLAYDHDGTRRWRTELPMQYGWTPGGLAVTEDLLYATVGGTVFAVDPESGTERWRFVTGADSAGPPTVDSKRVYVASKNLYALDRTDGTEQWRVVNEAPNEHTSDPTKLPYLARPPIADGSVYLRAGAFDATDGSRLWGDDADDWLASTNYYTRWYYDRPMARPVITADALYVAHAYHGVMKFQ